MSVSTAPSATGDGPRRGARVLLVDDDVLSQEVATGMLEELGFCVRVAGDGAEAVRAAAGGFDLILMDVQMPVMDGMSATRAIRAIPGCERLPIIAMSANTFPEDQRRCLEAGMNAHIPKPVDFGRMCTELARWLPADVLPAMAAALPSASTPPQASGTEWEIDVPAGLAFFSGREDAYRRMLQRFAVLRGGDVGLLRAALAAGDPQQAGRIAHSLKSMAATLGAHGMHAASAELERLIAEGDATAIAAGVHMLDCALRAACAEIALRFPADPPPG